MRIFTSAPFLLVLFTVVSPPAPPVGPPTHTPPVAMHVSVGYGEQYRTAAWAPVRVILHNQSGAMISGRVEIPARASRYMGPPQAFGAAYETPIVLPAGATKQVTLYIPGVDAANAIDVRLRDGNRTLATASDDNSSAIDQGISLGVMSTDPLNSRWVNRLKPRGIDVSVSMLTPGGLDGVPEVLASFDVIVLTNVDSSRLTPDQTTSLERFVRNGGTLLLVGGPDWQETLRPLPAALLPGHLAGSRTVPDLGGLRSIGYGAPPTTPTTVSMLTHPRGSVLASEGGVPLIVRSTLGTGQLMYLAFDPAIAPVLHWRVASNLLTHLLGQAAPLAMSRSASPGGPVSAILLGKFMGPWGGMAAELSNVPAAALPSLMLFIVLTVLYIVLLGPLNFLVLRRLGRRELSWVTVPALALLCVGSTFGVAYHLKGNTVLINTIGVVQLDRLHGPYPATLYTGLFAPVRGDYQLTYGSAALPATVPQWVDYGPGPPPTSRPVGVRFQEGQQTRVTFLSMNMWSMRDVVLHSSVDVPGTLRADLHPDAAGNIVGTIHNGTNLALAHPMIVAGHSITHLRDIPSGSTTQVRIRPIDNVHDTRAFWFNLYGPPSYQGVFWQGPRLIFGGAGPGPCCPGPSPPTEKNLADRIRNAGSMLPEVQSLSPLGEILLTAWSQQPLGSMTVDGSTPQRRDLNLIVSPLTVHFRPGPFQLRPGTLGAHLVDIVPVQTQRCCPFRPGTQPITFGSGGSATFQFDIPDAGHVRFKRLKLSVDAGGANGKHIGSVYSWRTARWVGVDLSQGQALLRDPGRFISPAGALMVRMTASGDSGDISIQDPHQDLQISGAGVAT